MRFFRVRNRRRLGCLLVRLHRPQANSLDITFPFTVSSLPGEQRRGVRVELVELVYPPVLALGARHVPQRVGLRRRLAAHELPDEGLQHGDRRAHEPEARLQRRPDGEGQTIPLRVLGIEKLPRDGHARERRARHEDTERQHERQRELLPQRQVHLQDVREHQRDQPQVRRRVQSGRRRHDRVVREALPHADVEFVRVLHRVADEEGEQEEHGAVYGDDSHGDEDEDPLVRQLQDAQVEEQDADLGHDQADLVAAYGRVGQPDADRSQPQRDVAERVAKPVYCFDAHDCDDGDGEYPCDQDERIVPPLVLQQQPRI